MPQTILILDDEPDNVLLLTETLKRGLPEVVTVGFTSPQDALSWCAANEPDLCLIDYKMPEMSGLDFLARVRQRSYFQGIPIIMITGMNGADTQQAALDTGATDFLGKPIDTRDVVARCRNHLRLRESLKRRRDDVDSIDRQVSDSANESIRREQEIIIDRLSRLSGYRDEETGNHMRRMANISQLIATELGYDSRFCEMILLAAPMHDVGKVGIPDRILLKPGKLDAAEWSIMKNHAVIGYDLLKGSSSDLLKMGASIAYSHHERFDGGGYPRGLAGEDIPAVGRIVAVADVFDALMNERHYKQAWPAGDVFALLRRERARHFDPECVDALLRRIGEVMDIQSTYAERAYSGASIEQLVR